VRAPLKEAGMTKADIRALAQHLGLPVWDKPAFACLGSRFPYGTQITPERLAQVESAEEVLWQLGFRQFRVRYHGEVARIEVDRVDILRLAGYRRGSMNEKPVQPAAALFSLDQIQVL